MPTGANGPGLDPITNLTGGVSIAPGTALSGTTAANGDWVDCTNYQGPVHGEFIAGAPTGTPTSFTATCKLQEADDSGGTGAQDIPVQTDLVLTAGKTLGYVIGRRTKRFVRCVATPAFVSGTTPTLPLAAAMHGEKIVG